jgi:hypothetical protein
MLRDALLTRPSIFALMAGALLLVVFSLIRMACQPLVDHVPVVAAMMSCLVFLIPGAITGLIAPRSFFWNGAILGMIAASFVTLQSNQFGPPNWSSIVFYETIGVWACLSVPLGIVGAFGGRAMSWRRQSHNS